MSDDKNVAHIRNMLEQYTFSDNPRDGITKALWSSVILLADQQKVLKERLENALNAAYINYDPLVKQVSELRQAYAELVVPVEAAAARDRLWCEAVITATHDLSVVSAVLKKFNELRDD
jgi:hypothetical protein